MSAALYLHIPFCRHKCIYCDFYSITQTSQIDRFLKALHREIELWAEDGFFRPQHFSTIYFGGGTPSLLSPEQIFKILEKISQSFDVEKDAEISMEANPGAVLANNLSVYRQAGINRLTLGIQSFQDEDLKFLTRIHSVADAESAFEAARLAGFDNIGIDLIFGLPNQTLMAWQDTLNKALVLQPEHISMYGLTYEENTPLWHRLSRGELVKCDESLERDMFLLGIKKLAEAGYCQYEISNFAVQGHESKHNQKYWDGSPFLGLGPSAHSFDGRKRWWNADHVNRYIDRVQHNQLPVEADEELSTIEKSEELILLGLRRRRGLSLQEFAKVTGITASSFVQKIRHKLGNLDSCQAFAASAQNHLLTVNGDQLCLTQQGLLLYDSVSEKISALVNKELGAF